MTIETRRDAASMRRFMEKEIELSVRQMRIEGVTLEDGEAELYLLANFVQAYAAGLRAAWPELMKGTSWELDHQGEA